ncbi:uncharacterized protein LOC122668455 [Telopea speciosissima]|uniref:uncharacterized protein LOC122668455 n=1 Tax=Telopea speciosissima TaxID=54955 RepID=UPI001CC7C781|nr:uncharacterized protein LOC122668455 [Telopea speciosissima]
MAIPSSYLSSIPILTGDNYQKWVEDLKLHLGLLDLDLALREPKPSPLTNNNTTEEKTKFEKWDNANRKCILVVKKAVPETIRGNVEVKDTVVEFLNAIKVKFELNTNAESSDLMSKLMNPHYDGGNVREYVLGLATIAAKLGDLDIKISDDPVVHIALHTLPGPYKVLQSTYTALRDKWSLDELISICTQEERKLKQNKVESANATFHRGSSGGPIRRDKKFTKKGRFNPYGKTRGTQQSKAS